MPRPAGCGANSCCQPHKHASEIQLLIEYDREPSSEVDHPKRLLNAGAFTMPCGRIFLPSAPHKLAVRAYEPDINRTAERLSRPAAATVTGAADAGVRARHRSRRGNHDRYLCA